MSRLEEGSGGGWVGPTGQGVLGLFLFLLKTGNNNERPLSWVEFEVERCDVLGLELGDSHPLSVEDLELPLDELHLG